MGIFGLDMARPGLGMAWPGLGMAWPGLGVAWLCVALLGCGVACRPRGQKWFSAKMFFFRNLHHMAPFSVLAARFRPCRRRASFPGQNLPKSCPKRSTLRRSKLSKIVPKRSTLHSPNVLCLQTSHRLCLQARHMLCLQTRHQLCQQTRHLRSPKTSLFY